MIINAQNASRPAFESIHPDETDISVASKHIRGRKELT